MRMKEKMEQAARALACAALFLASQADAAGLRTAFGEVVVKGLKIGQTYSLHKMLNLPMRIVNTGEASVDLLIDVIQTPSDSLKNGYEPIPDLSWVTLEKREFTLEPNHEGVTDITVSLPNDPSLLGRRFQADIWSRTFGGPGMFAVGMQSRLLIHVDSTPPTEEELKKKFVTSRLANLDFTLHPTVGVAEEVAVGREVDLKKEHKLAIKLINPNDGPLNFRIRSIPNWEALLSIPAGYADSPNAQWLKPAEDVIKIEGNSIRETALFVNIPVRPEFYGAKWIFPVSVEVLEQEIPVRVYYKLLVTTAKADEKKKEPAKP